MKTIQFCGGSYCEDTHPKSYLTLLADKLQANIVGKGKSSFGHERAIKTFQNDVNYTVFTWTEPHTIYHPKFGLNMSSCDHHKRDNNIFKTGFLFFKYLHDWKYFEERQIRDLYWFDREVLSVSNTKIVHLFAYDINYSFLNGINLNFRLDHHSEGISNNNTILNHLSWDSNAILANLLYEKLLYK